MIPLFICFFSHLLASSPSPYVWSLGYAMDSDYPPFLSVPKNYESHPPKFNPNQYLQEVKEGSVIWVQEFCVKDFYYNTLPRIKNRFVLIISDGDESFPSSYEYLFPVQELINHPKVIHIFAQNRDKPHPKVSPLPIGIDFHSMTRDNGYFHESKKSPEEQIEILNDILGSIPPTFMRKKRALVDFHLCDRGTYDGESRTSIFHQIFPSGVVDAISYGIPRQALWKMKGEYAFSVSPRGHGLDCHRTWEDLLLGCIVIVKTSPLDPLYEGLPVVIVKDWSEVNKENFEKWFLEYQDAFTNPSYREKLTQAYWAQKFRNKAHENSK